MSADKESPMNSQELSMVAFTAHDRCDGCGAQAYHKAVKAGLEELLFCNHHHRESSDNLLNAGWEIISHQEAIDKLVMAPG